MVLRSSIGYEVSPYTVLVYATAEYPAYGNYGHMARGGRSFVASQQFMSSALEYVKKTFPELLARDIEAVQYH